MKIAIVIAGFILAFVLTGCRSQHTEHINLYVDENVVSEEERKQSSDIDDVSVTNRHHSHDTFQTTVSTHQVYARSNLSDIDSPGNFVSANKKTQNNDITDTLDLMIHKGEKQDSAKSDIFTSDFLFNFPMTYDSLQIISNLKLQTQDLVIDSLVRTIHDLHTTISKIRKTDSADSALVSQTDVSLNDSTAIKLSPQESVSISLGDHQQHLLQTVQKTDTIHIDMEVHETPASDGNTKLSALHQDLNVKNDTVEQPARQLIIQQQPKADTVAIVKEVPELPAKDEDTKSSVLHQDLNAKNDTIQQLRGQLKNMQTPIQVTDTVFAIRELLVTQQEEMHSVLITAYYSMEKTIPEDEDTVLKQIRNIAESKTIEKVILSGHSDRSEGSTMNNRLMAERLDYMNEKIQSYIPAEKIYLQNFSNSIASDTIIHEEQCIEIRIFFLVTSNSSF